MFAKECHCTELQKVYKIYRRWQIAQIWQKKKSQDFAKFAKQNSTLRNICQSYYTARNSENCIHNIAIFSVRQSEDGGKHPCF